MPLYSEDAPFRIVSTYAVRHEVSRGGGRSNKDTYQEKLMKLIPGESISLYLAGSGAIPKGKFIPIACWSAVCLMTVICLRAFGTYSKRRKQPPDWIHVSISAAAFLAWLYSLGGPFALIEGFYEPYIGTLLILACSFFLPYVYSGPKER